MGMSSVRWSRSTWGRWTIPTPTLRSATFLLSEDSQLTFVAETQEYGLIAGVSTPAGLPPLAAFAVDTIDYELLGEGLAGTQELIRASGIER